MKRSNANLPLSPRNNWRSEENRGSARNAVSWSRWSTTRGETRNKETLIDFSNLSSLMQLINNNDTENLLLLVCKYLEQFKITIEHKLDIKLLPGITELVAKLCSSSFVANKYKILNITLNRHFFEVCHCFITTFVLNSENVEDIGRKFEQCLLNMLILFDQALQIMPSSVWLWVKRTVKLLEINITIMKKEKVVIFSESFTTLFKDTQEILLKLEAKYTLANKVSENGEDAIEPPDDFRMIDLCPELNELITRERNFVRENVIAGQYKNVDHYLDVHFRLLREDFINPIRQDICDYLNNVKRKFFNIKIHKNVQIIEPHIYKDNLCYQLKIKVTTGMRHSLGQFKCKRLMHGSLLIFTKDDFRSIFLGVVLNTSNILSQETVLISVRNDIPEYNIDYTMIECIIYFEPYYQVLKALQHLPANTLPMEKYILKADASIQKPSYLTKTATYQARVLQKNQPMTTTDLNPSQETAMRAVFNQEFVVIQGPPGTGKTYLGLQIVKKLLNIASKWWSQGPMLIICYTNHALDQFLGGLLDTTNKIVRLGSQSQEKKLKPYSMHELRKHQKEELRKLGEKNWFSGLISEHYRDLENRECEVKFLKTLLKLLKINNLSGILHIELLRKYVPQAFNNTCFHYFTMEDFMCWLLGDTEKNNCEATENVDEYQLYNLCSYFFSDLFNKNSSIYDVYTVSIFDMERVNIDIEDYIDVIKTFLQENIGNTPFDNSELLYLDEYAEVLKEKITFLEEHLRTRYESFDIQQISDIEDAFSLPTETRWRIYKSLINALRQQVEIILPVRIRLYSYVYRQLDELRQKEDIKVLKQSQIIGMTTTCAARLRHIIEEIKSPIVVVEEAAEVLEAHIVSSLTNDCQHLILLGDHKQLRPSTSDYLSDKKYKLSTSLFERMVNNNIQCYTLNVQHRMRPEIAKLLCPIYPDLTNHESVHAYPPVTGTKHSLFFIDHTEPEEEFGESSKLNIHEARFLIKFTEYLLKNSYAPNEITILATYLGQVATLKQEINFSKVNGVSEVHITAVDNFQGEENTIVLLSLVRSNADNNVGFLSTENRICVALSRAKVGLFIMGNMKQLSASSKLWQTINSTLQEQEAIGGHLPLICKMHNKLTLIDKPEDFQQLKNGGCNELCNTVLKCGHICAKVCHACDPEHQGTYKCIEICNRKLCDIDDHLCKKVCSAKCGDCEYTIKQRLPCQHIQLVTCCKKDQLEKVKCREQILIEAECGHTLTKLCYEEVVCLEEVHVELACGHKQLVKCCKKNQLEEIKCTGKVQVELACGHMAEKSCYILLENFKCPHLCNQKLVCGHTCKKTCHAAYPNHKRYDCDEICVKQNLRCCQSEQKHTSLVPCCASPGVCKTKVRRTCSHSFELVACYMLEQCSKPCIKKLPCQHRCRKECYRHGACGPCKNKVIKKSNCGHSFPTECGRDPEPKNCTMQCLKNLECGHKCSNLCNLPCTNVCQKKCYKKLDCGHQCINRCGEECACQYKPIPDCGHEMTVKCDEIPLREKCQKKCRKILECGHKCKELCNVPCATKCLFC